MEEKKVNLEEILFANVNAAREEFPDEKWYTDEQMKESSEFKHFLNAMKEACRQTLELATENACLTEFAEEFLQEGARDAIYKDSIKNTINQVG